MPTRPRPILEVLAFALTLAAAHAQDRWAPRAEAGPVDQLVVSGNACGPAALLAAFRCGDENWRTIPAAIPGDSDKAKLLYIIKGYGLRPSATLKDRKRWTGAGINAEDLSTVAGEIAGDHRLPAPRTENLFRSGRESSEKLLRRCHSRLRESLRKGLPPVLSLRRYVFRDGKWQALQGHFVTVVRVPEYFRNGSELFTFTYFDPWGGKKAHGTLRIPAATILAMPDGSSSCLEVIAPRALIGKSRVKPNERTVIVPTVLMGRW